MPAITLTISAPDLARAVDALSARWGYAAQLSNGSPNPQTRAEFVRLKIGEWVRSEVRAHELTTAQAAVTVSDIGVT